MDLDGFVMMEIPQVAVMDQSLFMEDEASVPVYFLGEERSGKSSLIHSLLTQSPITVNQPTEKIETHPLTVVKDDTGKPTTKATLFDVPYSKVIMNTVSMLFSRRAVYVIVVNVTWAEIPIAEFVHLVQARVTGCRFLVVCTHTDAIHPKFQEMISSGCMVSVREEQESLLRALHPRVSESEDTPLFSSPSTPLPLQHPPSSPQEDLPCDDLMPQLPESAIMSSCLTGQNLPRVYQQLSDLIQDVLNQDEKDATQDLTNAVDVVRELRKEGLFFTLDDFQHRLILCCGVARKVDEILESLKERQYILKLIIGERNGDGISTDVETIFCVQSQIFFQCYFELINHMLKSNAFQADIEKYRNPSLSLRSRPGIDESSNVIQPRFIRESTIFDILRELGLADQDMKHFVYVLLQTGLLEHSDKVEEEEIPASGLSFGAVRTFTVPFVDVKKRRPPVSSWTAQPHKDDLHISFNFDFLQPPPIVAYPTLIAVCFNTVVGCFCSPGYRWVGGVLIKGNDVSLNVSTHPDEKSIRVAARSLGTDFNIEFKVHLLWSRIAPVVICLTRALQMWPGLGYKMYISPLGRKFFYGHKIGRDKSFCLQKSITAAYNEASIEFLDRGKIRSLNTPLLLPFQWESFNGVEDWLVWLINTRDSLERVTVSQELIESTDTEVVHLSGNPHVVLKSAMRTSAGKAKTARTVMFTDKMLPKHIGKAGSKLLRCLSCFFQDRHSQQPIVQPSVSSASLMVEPSASPLPEMVSVPSGTPATSQSRQSAPRLFARRNTVHPLLIRSESLLQHAARCLVTAALAAALVHDTQTIAEGRGASKRPSVIALRQAAQSIIMRESGHLDQCAEQVLEAVSPCDQDLCCSL